MKKNIITALLSHDQAVCPHCDTKIGLKQISKYLLKGTNHNIQCPHCNRALHPKRATNAAKNAYGIYSWPETVVIGPDGTIVASPSTTEALEAELKKIYSTN